MRFIFNWLIAVSFLLTPTNADALTNYICKGEIGNGASEGSLEYKTYGKKTVRLGIQCNYYQRYISNECWGYLNSGNSRKGYFISNDWYFNGVLGQFNVKTGYIYYQLKEGIPGTNQNATQRWYNGWCTSS